ncbi:MAG: efflux RND transporter periplasmic adaptor subunit [Pseudomonadota bacterium]
MQSAVKFAAIVGLLFSGWLAAPTAEAQTFEFNGVIEPRESVTIAPRVDGVIAEVLFEGGESVAQGAILARMDPASYEIAVQVARAAVAQADAEYQLATDEAERQAELLDRGAGAAARASDAVLEAMRAEARLGAAQAELAAAKLSLARTTLRAPIAGVMGRPLVARGAFVEAEAGAAIGEVAVLDPVIIAYRVPHATRLQALKSTEAGSADALFERLRLALVLPDGTPYPLSGRALFESVVVDPESGDLITFAEFPNPERLLAPGLSVTVVSEIQLRDTQ